MARSTAMADGTVVEHGRENNPALGIELVLLIDERHDASLGAKLSKLTLLLTGLADMILSQLYILCSMIVGAWSCCKGHELW